MKEQEAERIVPLLVYKNLETGTQNMINCILSLLLSLSTTCGLSLKIDEAGWVFRESRSFIWLPVFLFLYLRLKEILQIKNKRQIIFSAIPAAIISLCQFLGYLLTEKGTCLWLLKDRKIFLSGLFYLCAWFAASFVIIYCCYRFLSSSACSGLTKISKPDFPVLWFLMAAAWLPWLLNQYPAIMTADTTDQIEMALGIEPLTNHHPVFFTMLLRFILYISTGSKSFINNVSYQKGIAIFCITQFLVMTAVFAFALKTVFRSSANHMIKIGTMLFFFFYPVHPLYSVTIWKDVPFAISLLLLITLLFCELQQHRKIYCIGIASAGIFLCLLRHNGIYILMLSLPFLPAAFKMRWKPVLAAFFIACLVYFGWNHILIPCLKIPAEEASEAFSVPLQQIALTAKRQKNYMDPALKEEINLFFLEPGIGNYYSYRISDPVKNRFNEDRYQQLTARFWRLWMNLGKTYPQDYLDGILLHTYGYWYPEMPHWVFITGIDDDGLFGIHSDPKLKTQWTETVVQWLSQSKYDGIPLLSLLFSPGACFWLYVIYFFYCMYKKIPAGFLCIPLFILWATALASPVNCEFRYVYGMFACLPILIAASASLNTQK